MTKPEMVSLISEKAEISKKAAAAVLGHSGGCYSHVSAAESGKNPNLIIGNLQSNRGQCSARREPPHRERHDHTRHEAPQVLSCKGFEGDGQGGKNSCCIAGCAVQQYDSIVIGWCFV